MDPTSTQWFEAQMARQRQRMARIRPNRRATIMTAQRNLYAKRIAIAIGVLGGGLGAALIRMAFIVKSRGIDHLSDGLGVLLLGLIVCVAPLFICFVLELHKSIASRIWACPLSSAQLGKLEVWGRSADIQDVCKRLAATRESLDINSIDFHRIERVQKRILKLEDARNDHLVEMNTQRMRFHEVIPKEEISSLRQNQQLQQETSTAVSSKQARRL